MESQTLMFAGRRLTDAHTLHDCGIQRESTIHLLPVASSTPLVPLNTSKTESADGSNHATGFVAAEVTPSLAQIDSPSETSTAQSIVTEATDQLDTVRPDTSKDVCACIFISNFI